MATEEENDKAVAELRAIAASDSFFSLTKAPDRITFSPLGPANPTSPPDTPEQSPHPSEESVPLKLLRGRCLRERKEVLSYVDPGTDTDFSSSDETQQMLTGEALQPYLHDHQISDGEFDPDNSTDKRVVLSDMNAEEDSYESDLSAEEVAEFTCLASNSSDMTKDDDTFDSAEEDPGSDEDMSAEEDNEEEYQDED